MNKAFRLERAEPRSNTACQNCETTVGPFVREVLKTPLLPVGTVLIGCKDRKGCSERRNALDAKRYPIQHNGSE